ncbi:MAG: hypothetical protein M3297_07100 [Thermoproteota archaeon]|jgi:hypothetical protein|nr:hypothetical protein [Thermoproteota archaeon]
MISVKEKETTRCHDTRVVPGTPCSLNYSMIKNTKDLRQLHNLLISAAAAEIGAVGLGYRKLRDLVY